ncbi:hypothetical protein [Chamaesiphon sp. OTE_75_metabat_556]|uniref:hypothetical protein n=1 Tax=Chamaesiphon sp. OTE_75_metabat_556 TaxID=2964692 RepID=UPI00286D1EC2|nr:hypothetical protein [Chamaesiphon sp. OTE_75_metabat_556]
MFKQLWKFSGLVGILLVVAGCSDRQPQATVSTPTTVNANPVPLAAPKNVWMTHFEQLNGTPYLYAPIYVAEQERKSILKQIKSASSSSYEDRWNYGETDIRNYMFVHRDNLSGSKLLANNSSRILQLEQIGEPLPPSKSNPDTTDRPNKLKTVNALWYVRAVSDTNSDKQLSSLDRKQIGISDVSGANYTEIIKDIDKILLNSRIGIDRRLVIYTSGSKRFVANINLPTRTATIKELPAIN